MPYRQFPLWLNQEELAELISEISSAIMSKKGQRAGTGPQAVSAEHDRASNRGTSVAQDQLQADHRQRVRACRSQFSEERPLI